MFSCHSGNRRSNKNANGDNNNNNNNSNNNDRPFNANLELMTFRTQVAAFSPIIVLIFSGNHLLQVLMMSIQDY